MTSIQRRLSVLAGYVVGIAVVTLGVMLLMLLYIGAVLLFHYLTGFHHLSSCDWLNAQPAPIGACE